MIYDKRVFAIVVLYNPHIPTLIRLIDSVRHQVIHIVLVDNSILNDIKDSISETLAQTDATFTYLDLGDNFGIATAHNKGIELAIKKNATHVLLLDQDSALPSNMVDDLMTLHFELLSDGHKVSALGPSFLDEKTNELAKIIRHRHLMTKRISPDESKNFMIADYIISSGSLISTEVLRKVGLMDEKLFIDRVDIEWCIRAKQYGYTCYVAPQVIMKHSVGDGFVSVGERKTNLHSDFRNYFIVRNSAYLAVYGQVPISFRVPQFGKIPLYILFYSYHSKKPLYSLGLLTKAVLDGVFQNMGKGHFKRGLNN